MKPGKSARISVETFDARLSALKERDAYKDHEKLALRRGQLVKEDTGPARPRTSSGWPRARTNVDGLQSEADTVASRRAELGRAIDRQLRALAEAAAAPACSATASPRTPARICR